MSRVESGEQFGINISQVSRHALEDTRNRWGLGTYDEAREFILERLMSSLGSQPHRNHPERIVFLSGDARIIASKTDVGLRILKVGKIGPLDRSRLRIKSLGAGFKGKLGFLVDL